MGWAPLTRMTIFHTGDSEWVALCWRPERPNAAQTYGPFRNQTEATKFGRKHFPRCYVVGAVASPDRFEQELAYRVDMERDGGGGAP